MLPRKPATSESSKVISIDCGRDGGNPPEPSPVSATPRKKSSVDYFSRRQALRRFFLGGAGVWKVHRESGVPTAEIENDLRELGYAEWERQNRRAA